jgi:hypothetical protein
MGTLHEQRTLGVSAEDDLLNAEQAQSDNAKQIEQ